MIVATAINYSAGERRHAPLGALIHIQLGEAIPAYETGGPAALRLALILFQLNGGSEGVLTDATGCDLVTGEDRSELVMSIRQQRLRMPLMKQDRAVIARMSADGEYVFSRCWIEVTWSRGLCSLNYI